MTSRNINKCVIIFLFITAFLASACSDDEFQDAVKEIKMYVSSETGFSYVFGSEQSIECMLVSHVGRQSRSMGASRIWQH